MAMEPLRASGGALDVGDPRRPVIGRAVLGTLLAAFLFFMFTLTKQIKPIYVHAPWENDPYDTVFSFTMFFVPLVAGFLLVPLSLCRRSQPLPISRAEAVLRGCRLAVAAALVELLSAWLGVIVGANEGQWTRGATGGLIALLGLATVSAVGAALSLRRAPRLSDPSRHETAPASDWLMDAVTVAERESGRLGRLQQSALVLLAWVEESILGRVRRHPVLVAAAASSAFGVAVFGYQGIREGYSGPVTVLAMILGFCGMFPFLVLAGSYLGVARSPRRLTGISAVALWTPRWRPALR
jgi:hypothetical protein